MPHWPSRTDPASRLLDIVTRGDGPRADAERGRNGIGRPRRGDGRGPRGPRSVDWDGVRAACGSADRVACRVWSSAQGGTGLADASWPSAVLRSGATPGRAKRRNGARHGVARRTAAIIHLRFERAQLEKTNRPRRPHAGVGAAFYGWRARVSTSHCARRSSNRRPYRIFEDSDGRTPNRVRCRARCA